MAMCIALITDVAMAVAYLAYSAFLLSFDEIWHTGCGVALFFYVFTSSGGYVRTVGSINTSPDKETSK